MLCILNCLIYTSICLITFDRFETTQLRMTCARNNTTDEDDMVMLRQTLTTIDCMLAH